MIESWKEIEGYEGYYEVSNLGNIRTMDRIIYKSDCTIQTYKSKPLSIGYNKRNNVCVVYLNKDGNKKACVLHRVVASAFCVNDDLANKTSVNHIDGDRKNNKANNLEWVSYGENLKHSYDVLHRQKNKPQVFRRECISCNKTTHEKITYRSIAQASRETKISETQIRRIANKECINAMYDFEVL